MPDFEKKSSLESIKLIVNSKDYLANKLVIKFIQLLYENKRFMGCSLIFSLLVVLFVLF